MKYLLDTHTFLWTVAESTQLSQKAKAAIQNPKNDIFISAVNLWEISIKTRLKKIDLKGFSTDDLIGIAQKMSIQLISLSPEEAVSYGQLEESTHFDPFDRMLIWQAICQNYTIISKDSQFKKFKNYGLRLLWD